MAVQASSQGIQKVLPKSGRRGALALALLVTVAGCSVLKKKAPTLAYEERPVELLYSTGAHELDHHQWSSAVNYFREVERQHPYSEWARRAILMTAYAHYQANDYAEAVADANRFIALYPGNVATPYAFYLRAVCYFEQIVDVGRDQASTEQAQGALGELIKRYPTSNYAVDAKLKLDMVNDQLGGKEMTIGRFYLRNGDPIAAIGRFKTVVDRYQTTTHAPEALYRLIEAYLTIGLVDEAVKTGAVLGFNYPGDPWYHDAYRLLTSKGLRPSLTPSPQILPHLPFTRHAPSGDIAPPPVEVAAVSKAGAPASVALAAPATEGPKTKTKKKGGFVHGLLGL
ncbi:MAG TPA: outer membrane protein assembly factor BamD [Caulobacteraceae bacterium]|jgi:outer membrane protein assembly factor BamD|nr:outer membrane protein assembly factor BamD [Caulobacteraceae bacterium]